MIVNIAEAKAKFSSLLAVVGLGKEEVVISKRNKPIAVLLSYETFQQMKKAVESNIDIKKLEAMPSTIDKYTGIVSEAEIDYDYKESRESYLKEKYL